MNQVRYYRKYPRTYEKQHEQDNERTIDLSVATAAGILVLTFAKGMFWGYMLKRMMR